MLLNLVLLLVLGFIAGKFAVWLRLPSLLGMLMMGIVLGPHMLNFIDKSLLGIAQELRLLALIVILLRAGLGLDKTSLVNIGRVAIRLSWIPCMIEGTTIMLMSVLLLKFSWIEGGLLGFVLAAVSPAVVVPSMIALREQGYGEDKGISTMLLAGASMDDIFAITIFSSFLGLALDGSSKVWLEILSIPFGIGGGILGGLVVGMVLLRLYEFRFIKSHNMVKLLLLLSLALVYYVFGEWLGIASLLGIVALGFILLEKDIDSARDLSTKLTKIWVVAQIILFVLVGVEVNVNVVLEAGTVGLIIIFFGLLGRSLGVWLATRGTNLNSKERAFCMIAYLPKATVQAAVGGIPLAMGLKSGVIILAVSVLAILITVPLGAIGIKLGAPLLLSKE